MMGFVDINTLPSDQPLHQVQNASLPPAFVRAYEQIGLDVGVGGHGLRKWAHHADAAYVGQWALTVQSATEVSGECHYPVLNQEVEAAAAKIVVLSTLNKTVLQCPNASKHIRKRPSTSENV